MTITGSNFGTTAADNIVTFNSINATITAASATSVTATVPINATTGRVKVQTREGTATSTGLFVVPTGTFTAADVLSTQTIVVDGPSVTANVNVAGKVVQLIFDASAGQSLGLGIGPVSFLPTTGTAMVNVHAPDGTVIATLGVPSVGSSVQLKNLPLTGVYTIAFNTVSTATASASFTLSSSAYSAGTLVIDASPAAFSIPRQGQSGVISFSGTQGQWLALVVTGFPSTNYFEFTFVRPDGSTWFGYQSVTSGTVLALPILPTTGIYKIRMTPIGATIGSFTLALLSDQPGTISLGVVTTVNFDGSGRLLRYTFPWQANTPIAIEALGPTLNGYANISDSNGAAFSSINFFAGQSAMNTHGTSPAGGTYSMRVVRSTTANGSVSLRVGTADLIVEDIVPILGPDIYPPNGYPTVGNSHQASISIRNVGGAGVQFCSFQVFLSPNASGYPRTNLLGSFSSLTPTFAGQYCGSFYNLYLERAGIAAGVYYYVVELSPNDPVTTNNTLVKGPYNLRCFTCSVSN